MGGVRNEVYIHVVWATWNREPLLTADVRPRVLAAIADDCRELGVEVMALNAMAEHVHLLVRLPTTVTVAKLVQQVKGSYKCRRVSRT